MTRQRTSSTQLIDGFSLIELIIVVTIVSILASIAFPSYKTYLQKGRRAEAIAALIKLEAAEESYRFSHSTYGTLVNLSASSTSSPKGYYNLSISNISASIYTLTATATGVQAADTDCATMRITVSGGTALNTPMACWSGS